jgi:hypothetical protein
MQQTTKRQGFMNFVSSALKEYTASDSPVKMLKTRKNMCEFLTLTCPQLMELAPYFSTESALYGKKGNVKVVSPHIESLITPVTVAFWFCGDGSKADHDELSQYISTSLVVVTTSASRATSASGKFVEKSLKGVRNKLKNVQDSKECQAVLISWARTLVEADVVSVVGTDFYLNLAAALQSTPAAGSSAAAKKAKRAGSSVESTSTG